MRSVSLPALFVCSVASNPQKNGGHLRIIALSLTLLALPVVPAGADSPAAATKIHWVFDIVRGNDKIGTDTIDIERQNDTTTIKIKKDVSVKVSAILAHGETKPRRRDCQAEQTGFEPKHALYMHRF